MAGQSPNFPLPPRLLRPKMYNNKENTPNRDATQPLTVTANMRLDEGNVLAFDMSPIPSGTDSGFYPTPPPEAVTPLGNSPGVGSPLSPKSRNGVVGKNAHRSSLREEAATDSDSSDDQGLVLHAPQLRNAYQPPTSNTVCEQLEKSGVVESLSEWPVMEMSQHARDTINPIRAIVDVMSVEPNPKKSLIKLHLGDPTLTGTMTAHESAVKALTDSINSHRFDGYGPAVGSVEVRRALAEHVTSPEAPVGDDDLILTSGCSHALQLAIEAVAGSRQNILVPKPGFPLYSTLMKPHGIEDRHYNLLEERDWEIDLDHLESLIDVNTKAIIVNNPSNPCGAVYSKQHLCDILQLAYKHKLVIIADEIYGDLTYDGSVFYPLAQLTPKVPIICCDGIGKRYLVPGWRLGWVVVHDHYGALRHVKDGMRQLANKIVGPCAVVQGALPHMLKNTPSEFFDGIREILSKNAKVAYEILQATPGLHPVRPKGAMYMMVKVDAKRFPAFPSEMQFLKQLIAEESVYCLPGSAFGAGGWFRLVMTYPETVTRDACERVKAFCLRHSIASKHINQAFEQAFTTVTPKRPSVDDPSPPNRAPPMDRTFSATQMS